MRCPIEVVLVRLGIVTVVPSLTAHTSVQVHTAILEAKRLVASDGDASQNTEHEAPHPVIARPLFEPLSKAFAYTPLGNTVAVIRYFLNCISPAFSLSATWIADWAEVSG